MPAGPSGKGWKGMVASLILWGAGQFFSGARWRGIGWCTVSYLGPLGILFLYSLLPARSGIVLLALAVFVWAVMLYDSYRPIRLLHWWGWVLLIATSLMLSEVSLVALHRLFA